MEVFLIVWILFLSLYLIKSLSIDAADDALGDEGLMVDGFYQAEDGNGFGFLRQKDDHFDRFAGITADTVQNGTSAAQVVDDPFGYLVVFLGEDQELDRLPVAVQYQV